VQERKRRSSKRFFIVAADVGADGLILYRGREVAGRQGFGMNGGWIMTTAQHAVYRGEPIHFK
jgi:hypothetical protein